MLRRRRFYVKHKLKALCVWRSPCVCADFPSTKTLGTKPRPPLQMRSPSQWVVPG